MTLKLRQYRRQSKERKRKVENEVSIEWKEMQEKERIENEWTQKINNGTSETEKFKLSRISRQIKYYSI